MNAALEVEWLKMLRAPVYRGGAAAVTAGVPTGTAALFWLAGLGTDSTAGAKAQAMVTDLSLAGYLGYSGQILSVALLVTGGIAISWSFGREFVDRTVHGLFAIATPRHQVAAAKVAVFLGWGAVVTTVTTLISVGVGLVLQPEPFGGTAAASALRMLGGGVLVVASCVPFGLVASWRRSYLAGIVALLVAIVIAQILTTAGVGGWFPYTTASLWLGMGGEEAAEAITVPQLLMPLLAGALGVWGTQRWWSRAAAV